MIIAPADHRICRGEFVPFHPKDKREAIEVLKSLNVTNATK